ncbi:alpha/beta hydrolase [Nonomuraea sp. NPDC000554]|uniref:alpha/beta hydrolase n=1 Tax=Nonomuraea sp. NPDC000554 TaxID=3154259 RepID=UPI003316F62A
MKRVVGIVTGVVMLAVGAVQGEGVAAAKSATGIGPEVTWQPCPTKTGSGKASGAATPPAPVNVECGSVRVPLDYREPMGQSIKIAVNRIKATVPHDGTYLGPLLVNPGGPGASGQSLAEYVAEMLPAKLAARYDIIGFDPRGVGKSEPALHCVDADRFYAAPRYDEVPRTRRDERVLLDRAKQYADKCGNLWAWMLPHMSTENSARDMDSIRQALGEPQISFFGYSYGTYLGAVYSTLFPDRIKRLVMDSSVDPSGVWYKANLAQNLAFDRRHRNFLAWTAKNNAVYKLGDTVKETSFAWYAMRSRLRDRPAAGVVGPSELDDAFTVGGYTDGAWPDLAAAWSTYVRKGDGKALLNVFNKYGKPDAHAENGYAVYLAVQCRDARWPRDWAKWREDMSRVNRKAPFMTWPNAWYNAPCLYWSVPGGSPVQVSGAQNLPPILMIQSRGDAATPYQGALEMRKRFPTARMVVEAGGNHGVSLSGNRCVDKYLVNYLNDGSVPAKGASCAANDLPQTATRMASKQTQDHE